MPDRREPKTVFDHEAFDYVGIQLRDYHDRERWLPFFVQLGLTTWLYAAGLVTFTVFERMPSRFTRLLLISGGIWFVFIGMGLARRFSRDKVALSYAERRRRLVVTTLFSTAFIIGWAVLTMWILSL